VYSRDQQIGKAAATRVPPGRAAIRWRGSPLPVLGPLSLSLPPPARCFRTFLPASTERANIVQVSSLSRHRSRNVGHGHGFCIFAASSSPALWQLPSGKASAHFHSPTPAPPKTSAYLSASSSPARPAPVRITPRYCKSPDTAKRSSHRTRFVGSSSCRVAPRQLSPTSSPPHPITSRYV